MFTILSNQYHEENVNFLIQKHQSSPPAAAQMYRSKYSDYVKQEACCNKTGCSRTMGVPKSCVDTPCNFLRKNSKAPISVRTTTVPRSKTSAMDKECQAEAECKGPSENVCENSENEESTNNNNNTTNEEKCSVPTAPAAVGKAEDSCQSEAIEGEGTNKAVETCDSAEPLNSKDIKTTHPACSNLSKEAVCGSDTAATSCSRRRIPRICCNVAKPPIQKACCSFEILDRGNRDFIRSNATKVVRQPPPVGKPRYVDQMNGFKVNWNYSGYDRRYVDKKNFGQVPEYLEIRKQDITNQDLKKQEEMNQMKADIDNKCRHLSEPERSDLLCGLKKNWEITFTDFQSLPLLIDTPGKIRRKNLLEGRLKNLEKDIQMVSRHNHIFVADADKSFYLA